LSDSGEKKKFLKPEEIDRAVTTLLEIVAATPDRKVALVGGAALQAYGSPRQTSDVDFVANWTLGPQAVFRVDHPLSFGGLAYVLEPGITVDLIVRNDAYQALYEEALREATAMEGIPILTPDYLAALKFAADREKDRVDLAWLLGSDLVDVNHVGDIVERTMGGRPARDVWEKMSRRMLLALRKHRK
jgi:hypothetical protein